MFKTKWLLLLWPVFLLLFVFWEPFTTAGTLFHPDWAPYFEKGAGPGFYELFVNRGRSLSPLSLIWAILPSRVFHLAFYPIMVMGIFLGVYLFLRNRALPRAACALGALSLAFSGYLLTLVAAGHRGVFEAMFSAVVALLCIDRALRGRGLVYFVLASLAISLSLGTQPDVLAMIGMFIAAYGVMACWRYREQIHTDRRRFFIGIAAGLLALMVSGAPGLIKIRDIYLPGRQAIEEGEISDADAADADKPAGLQIRKSEKWEFCTNWSLPLADLPELIVPLIFGTETTDRKAPFWGELGRTLGWQPGQPGFRNFRQHTVYIGLIQVLLAFYAIGFVIATRKTRRLTEPETDCWQVPFWSVCAVISLLLTLGRYTPFYRLFFALPLADTIRAPVKFLHVTNLSVAILAAYGLAFLLRGCSGTQHDAPAKKQPEKCSDYPRRFAIACGGVSVLLIIAGIIVKAATPAFARYWSSIGFPPDLHTIMMSQMTGSIIRAAFLAALTAGVVFWSSHPKSPRWAMLAMGVVLCVVVGLDMAAVGKRFVRTVDLSVHESRNDAVLDMIQQHDYAPRVVDLLTSRGPHDPLRVNLKHYYAADIRLLDEELGADSTLLQQGGANIINLARLLVATGTEYVLGRREQVGGLINSPEFKLVGSYDFSGRIVRSSDPRRSPIILLEVVNALPRAAVFTKIIPVASKQRILQQLFASDWNPRESVLVEAFNLADMADLLGNSAMSAREVTILQSTRWHMKLEVRMPQTGVLLINEPYKTAWKAHVGDEQVKIIRANADMMAVRVPLGENKITFDYSPGFRTLWFSNIPTLILLLIAVSVIAVRTKQSYQ